jgi:hypothetical protein
VNETELADSVLSRLVRAANGDSSLRFMVTPSIDRSGGYRVTYVGGRFTARIELFENLLKRKLIQVIEERSGSLVIGVTIRGYDYYTRHLADEE